MPGISGRDLADQLAQVRPDVKVLYMSGYTHDLVTQRGILASGSELLQKPFAISALLRKVRDMLDGKVMSRRGSLIFAAYTVRLTQTGRRLRCPVIPVHLCLKNLDSSQAAAWLSSLSRRMSARNWQTPSQMLKL